MFAQTCPPPQQIAGDDFSDATWDGTTWGGGTGWADGWQESEDSSGEQGPNLPNNMYPAGDGGEGWNSGLITCDKNDNSTHNDCEPTGSTTMTIENKDYVWREIDLGGFTEIEFEMTVEWDEANDSDVFELLICTAAGVPVSGDPGDPHPNCTLILTIDESDFDPNANPPFLGPITKTGVLTDPAFLMDGVQMVFFQDDFSGSSEYMYINEVKVFDNCPPSLASRLRNLKSVI